MRNTTLCVALSLLFSPAQAQIAQIASSGNAPAKVTTIVADTSSSGITIPSDFVGFSVEVQDFVVKGYFQGASGIWNSQASASSFVSLVSLLGANGSFRIGGSSADTASTPALTQQMVTNLGTFLTALGAGWKPIYNLDLKSNDSATAATQAGFFATTFGAANVVFQMGNEPVSSGNFSIGTYQTAWNAYYTAITGAVAGAKFAAWDEFNWGNAQTAINGLTPGVSGLSYVTYHWYNINGQVPTTSYLLNSIDVAAGTTFTANTVWAGSVPQRLSESNSVNSGGQSGISDRLMAATWYLDQAIVLARLGYAGINTHMYFTGETAANGNQGWYNPVVIQADQNAAPSPIFYGQYLFSKVQGQQIINSAVSGNAKITALATLRSAGKANILIANNDPFDLVPITPQQAAAWSTANVLQIKGAAGCNEANPTIGGQAIGESGSWSGAPFSISNGQSITLGPCEAALVSVQ